MGQYKDEQDLTLFFSIVLSGTCPAPPFVFIDDVRHVREDEQYCLASMVVVLVVELYRHYYEKTGSLCLFDLIRACLLFLCGVYALNYNDEGEGHD